MESIASQSYNNIEAIVIDDNADPAWNGIVKAVVERIKEKFHDFSIRLICNDLNKGSAETRNVGILAARGKYITFLDDDDIYLPEKIEVQVKDMMASQADFGITDLNLYNSNEKLVDQRIRTYIKRTDRDSLLRYHYLYHMTGTDTLMFKANYLKQIGLFPPIDVGDEFFLIEKAIEYGGKFCYSPHCYVKAYVHYGAEESLSSSEDKIRGENLLYESKKEHFDKLSAKDIRYIKVRHHMVIAYRQFRRRYWLSLIKHSAVAFIISPINMVRIVRRRG